MNSSQCTTVESILKDWSVAISWSAGACCGVQQSNSPNLTTGDIVYCDAYGNIIGINLGRGTHMGVASKANKNILGTLPSSFGDLSSLQILLLDGNTLQGKIPYTFANLRNLKVLDLSNNALEGSLDSISSLAGLNQLYLSNNQFKGSACMLNNMTNLDSLELSNNGLSGPAPNVVSSLSGWKCRLEGSGLCLLDGTRTQCSGSLQTCKTSDCYVLVPSKAPPSYSTLTTSNIIIIAICSGAIFIILGALLYSFATDFYDKNGQPSVLVIETTPYKKRRRKKRALQEMEQESV